MSTPLIKSATRELPPQNTIDKLYLDILEETLTPPDIQEQLIDSQSLEQKWNFVLLHKGLTTKEVMTWSDKETRLLQSIDNARSPDIHSLLSLKVILASGKPQIIESFIELNGINVLINIIIFIFRDQQQSAHVVELEEKDIAILYEILLCCKMLMNSSLGMTEFLEFPRAMDAIVLCILFDYKHLAMLALEILSASCYSETSTTVVITALRNRPRPGHEPPFASLINAIVAEDIEVKASVMQCINAMIIGSDTESRIFLRSTLSNQHFIKSCDEAILQVEAELDAVEEVEVPSTPSTMSFGSPIPTTTTASGLKVAIGSAMLTPRTQSVNNRPASVVRHSSTRNHQSIFSPTGQGGTGKRNSQEKRSVMNVDKLGAGQLVALKGVRAKSMRGGAARISTLTNPNENTENNSSAANNGAAAATGNNPKPSRKRSILELSSENQPTGGELIVPTIIPGCFAGKTLIPTRKWTSLTPQMITQHLTESPESAIYCSILIAEIKEVRKYTTDRNLLKLGITMSNNTGNSPLSYLEIYDGSSTVFSVAFTNSDDRDSWFDTIESYRTQHIIQNSSYFMQKTYLELRAAIKCANKFITLVKEFKAMLDEEIQFNRQHCGLNLHNLQEVVAYLQKELVVQGLEHHLLGILQDCMLIPSGAEGIWEAIKFAVEKILILHRQGAGVKDLDTIFVEENKTLAELIEKKQQDTEINKQISKLALTTLQAEQEVKRLKDQLQQYEFQYGKLAHVASPNVHEESKQALSPMMGRRFPPVPGEKREEAGVNMELFPSKGTSADSMQSIATTYPTLDSAHRRIIELEKKLQQAPADQVAANLPTPPPSTTSTCDSAANEKAVQEFEEKFGKFFKMKKMMVPEGGIRQKMAADGITAKEMDDFFAGKLVPPTASSDPAPTATNTSKEETPAAPVIDPKFEKFVKMQKMKIPEGAIRQKMTAEGLSAQEIDDFFSGKLSQPSAALMPPPPPTEESTVDPKFEKFVKMQKMKVPEGAIRQKMTAEGISNAEIDAFLSGKPLPAAAPAAATTESAADERYEKFAKMQKMKIPEGAIRQKMTAEGFSAAEIDAFLSGKPLPAASAAPTAAPVVDERQEKLEKFVKMQKMKIPEGAIRQKMTAEGFKPDEIDAFLSGKPLPPLPTASAAAPSVADDRQEKLEKFVKMQKMNIPEGAIRQKMTVEGFTNEEIDAFLTGKPLPPKASASSASSSYDPVVYGKYEKLKKIMPLEAIKKKMIMDGIAEKDAAGFLGLAASSSAAPATKPAVGIKAAVNVVKATNKLKSLFWTKITSTDEIQETVWKSIPPYPLTKEHEAVLEQWFSAKPATTSSSTASSKGGISSRPSSNNLGSLSTDSNDGQGGGSSTPNQSSLRRPSILKGISLLDGRRNQNVLIFLGKLRKTPEEIRDMIWALNPNVLTVELTTSLRGILPTPEEMQTFHTNSLPPDQLDSASRLFAYLVSIPALATRLGNHEIIFNWFTQHTALDTSVACLEMACAELISTRSTFHSILSMILSLGNCLNASTRYGDAQGIQLDILSKLSNLKSTSNAKETFLHFFAKILADKEPKLLTWSENWKGIWVAGETLQFSQLSKDIQALERQVTLIANDHKKLLKEEDFKKKQENQPYLLRLEHFLNEAQPKLTELVSKRNALEEQIKKLLQEYHEEYPSPNAEEDACQKFFSTIVIFYRQLLKAHEENVKQKQELIRKAKIEEEKQRRMDMKASKSVGKDLKSTVIKKIKTVPGASPPGLQVPNTTGHSVGAGKTSSAGATTPTLKKSGSTNRGEGGLEALKAVETPQENVFKRFHVSRRLENPTIQQLLASGHLGGISEEILGSGGAKSLLGNTNPIASPASPSSPTSRLVNGNNPLTSPLLTSHSNSQNHSVTPATTSIQINNPMASLHEDSINQFRRKLQNSVRFKKDFDITKAQVIDETEVTHQAGGNGGEGESKDSDDEGDEEGVNKDLMLDSDDEVTPLDSRNKTPTVGSALKL